MALNYRSSFNSYGQLAIKINSFLVIWNPNLSIEWSYGFLGGN